VLAITRAATHPIFPLKAHDSVWLGFGKPAQIAAVNQDFQLDRLHAIQGPLRYSKGFGWHDIF
jgi:hypothetical protein